MIYRKSRYDLALGRPGVVVPEEKRGEYFLVYGPQYSGKTTFLLNQARNTQKADIICFITQENFAYNEMKIRPATIVYKDISLVKEGIFDFFDWIFLDDFENILTFETIETVWKILRQARKGAYVVIRDKASCKFFNMSAFRFIDLI